MKRCARWLFFLLLPLAIRAYQETAPPPSPASLSPAQVAAQADRQKMMDLLHIDSLRQGANGNNPQAPNAANYDEAKANPYPNLPDPLLLNSGKKVTSAKIWWNQRRPEIVELFDREIYGRVPKNVPKVKWEVASTKNEMNGDLPVITRELIGHVDNSWYRGYANWGELVENVAATNEYHWMAGNFLKYAGPKNWNDLPVDSHELVAMCAPRPVFLSAGATNGDGWVDAKGTFLAGVGAGPVYKLLGKRDLGTTQFPAIETPLIDGDVAFRQHSGGHTPGPNWPTFITFASRYIKTRP
jgi:hypothetical protein